MWRGVRSGGVEPHPTDDRRGFGGDRSPERAGEGWFLRVAFHAVFQRVFPRRGVPRGRGGWIEKSERAKRGPIEKQRVHRRSSCFDGR